MDISNSNEYSKAKSIQTNYSLVLVIFYHFDFILWKVVISKRFAFFVVYHFSTMCKIVLISKFRVVALFSNFDMGEKSLFLLSFFKTW